MRSFFQNLNDRGRKLFHFRGTIYRGNGRELFSYELCSGFDFRFKVKAKLGKTSLSVGFLFFTIYLTVYGLTIPLLTKPREYGFYFHDWSLWITFGSKEWESGSSDPWYHRIVIRPIDIIFGKTIYFAEIKLQTHSPQRFFFRGRVFQMDEIKIERANWFRSRVPYGLYKKQLLTMELNIKDPPRRAGKGENSWDCGDDGSFGLSGPYKGPAPTWRNTREVWAYCCDYYCRHVMRDIQKYGRASGDQEIPPNESGFSFIGYVDKNQGTADAALHETKGQ